MDNKAAIIPQQQSKCAVFVVPIGREHEWLFCSEEGQFQVCSINSIIDYLIILLNIFIVSRECRISAIDYCST